MSGKFKNDSETPPKKRGPEANHLCRLVIYFPISALVTLFGNILQNPLDQRAKSDVRLMNLVVTFLSMLGQEAEQGGVHRMLGICSEFCRIAQRVIEKADREQSSRRKRRPAESAGLGLADGRHPSSSPNIAATAKSTTTPATSSTHTPQHASSSTAATTPQTNVHDSLSPEFAAARAFHGARNRATPLGSSSSPAVDSMGWTQDYQMGQDMDFDSFADLAGFDGGGGFPSSSPLPNGGSVRNPLLPQDLFAISMGLDWNWVESYPTVENGFGNLENTGVIDPRQQPQ